MATDRHIAFTTFNFLVANTVGRANVHHVLNFIKISQTNVEMSFNGLMVSKIVTITDFVKISIFKQVPVQ